MAHIEAWTETRRPLLRKRTQYCWRIRASNGRILCHSGEGYNNLADMWSAINSVATALGASLDKPLPIHKGKPKS